MSAGARWTQEEKHGVVNNQAFPNGNFQIRPLTVGFDKKITFTNLSPKVSLDYKVTDNVLAVRPVLARLQVRRLQHPRQRAAAIRQEPYDDEQVDSLEVGSKMGSSTSACS